MVCIYCGGKTKVINSRSRQHGLLVWRRRACQACKAVFTTEEGVSREQALMVKRVSRYEPFLRDKLLLSIYDSLKHRKTAIRDATALTDTVWQKLLPHFSDGAIVLSKIAETTEQILKRFDETAAVHYQAFHRS